jgi:hypothetical protein
LAFGELSKPVRIFLNLLPAEEFDSSSAADDLSLFWVPLDEGGIIA